MVGPAAVSHFWRPCPLVMLDPVEFAARVRGMDPGAVIVSSVTAGGWRS